jgi:hypothetical protein
VTLATRDDLDRAVASAARAFPKWSQTPPIRRAGARDGYGEKGVRFYTNQKSIMQRRPASKRAGAEFSMPADVNRHLWRHDAVGRGLARHVDQRLMLGRDGHKPLDVRRGG